MGRDLTRRRHGRHRDFDRTRRSGDTLGFLSEQQVRLDANANGNLDAGDIVSDVP